MDFGTRLKALMKERGVSQYRMALDIGTNTTTVGRWVYGQSMPRPIWQKEIARYFGMTVEELMQRDVHPRTKEGQPSTAK